MPDADNKPQPIEWAADLIPALRETGTGEKALDVIRAAMAEKFNGPAGHGHPPEHPARHLSAAEAIAALEAADNAAGRPAGVTVLKARALARTGTYTAPAGAAPARGIEDLIPPPPGGRAPRAKPAERPEGEKAGDHHGHPPETPKAPEKPAAGPRK